MLKKVAPWIACFVLLTVASFLSRAREVRAYVPGEVVTLRRAPEIFGECRPDVTYCITALWRQGNEVHVMYDCFDQGLYVGQGYKILQEHARPPGIAPWIDWGPLWNYFSEFKAMRSTLHLVRQGEAG